jgi:hypothetical protein
MVAMIVLFVSFILVFSFYLTVLPSKIGAFAGRDTLCPCRPLEVIFPSSEAVAAPPSKNRDLLESCCYTLQSAIIRGQTQRPGKKILEARGSFEPVTELLLHWRAGDQACLNQLVPLIEGELRRIAHRYVRMERHAKDAAAAGL